MIVNASTPADLRLSSEVHKDMEITPTHAGEASHEIADTLAFNANLTPRERLKLVSSRLNEGRNNDLGVGHHIEPNGQKTLVFTNLESSQVVSVPTRLSREAFDSVMDRVLPIDETKVMLFELAKAYDQRTPIMLEGGTAIGKTYTVNLFANLLYGEKATIPDFYCNGQTDVSELMGKYVPATLKSEDQARITQYLKSDQGAALKAEMIQELNQTGGGQVSYKELFVRAAAELGVAVDERNFEFQLGVLPKAMTARVTDTGHLEFDPDGEGVLLHVQEVGMAAPSVVNALLQIRGEKGKVAESIQVWQDGGREVKAGPGFFVVFSTNPPGKGFQERFEVDQALARGLVWLNLPDRLSDESLRKASGKIFSFDKVPPQSGTVIDIRQSPELGEVIGGVMAKFHKAYTELLSNGEMGRKQKVPATLDSLWRVAELIQQVQVISADGQSVDMVATLRQAVKGIYVNCLQDKPDLISSPDLRSGHDQSMGANVLLAFDQFLNGDVDGVQFRGATVPPRKAIETLTQEALLGEDVKSGGKQGAAVNNDWEKIVALKKTAKSLREIRTLAPGSFNDLYGQATKQLSESEKERLDSLLEEH